VGIFPRLPLRLYAEPRLWGAIVLDIPKNPQRWRGVAFGMGDILRSMSKGTSALVHNSDGSKSTVDGRHIYLCWSATRHQAVFRRAKRRWLRRNLRNGTLDVAWGSLSTVREDRVTQYVMGAFGCVLLVVLWMAFGVPFVQQNPAQRVWIDWALLVFFFIFYLSLPAILGWQLVKRCRRSCRAFRITSTAIVPSDGPSAGIALPYAGVRAFDEYAMGLIRLRSDEATLIIDSPPLPIAELLGREEEQRQTDLRLYRRLFCLAGAGVVAAVAALVSIQPITGMPIWKPLVTLAAAIPLFAFGIFGERWLKGLFARIERRSRQRRNRQAGAAGRR